MHQATLRTNRNLYVVLNAFLRLPKEHYPEIAAGQREWLAQQVSDELTRLDLAHNVIWNTENTWTRPPALEPLIAITDYYRLTLENDVPVILALRSWANEEIANYYRTHGITPHAQETLADLLRSTENDNIPRHAITFLRQTDYHSPAIEELLTAIATDATRPALRTEAIERLASAAPSRTRSSSHSPKTKTMASRSRRSATSSTTSTRQLYVARSQPSRTHNSKQAKSPSPRRPTSTGSATSKQRSLSTTCDDCDGERSCSISGASRTSSRTPSPPSTRIAPQQRSRSNSATRQTTRASTGTQEAEKFRREARIEAAQHTPFDTVLRKLKGATSMIHVKVWCEGDTDRPIFHKLLTEGGEHDMAATLDFVGGWPNFLIKEPERWLDGCRHAVIILDGDRGRHLTKSGLPYTPEGKRAIQLCKPHAITLHILQRYGIENYFPRHACEAVLQRDLAAYFPIPVHKPIKEHFSEPRPWWRTILDRIQRRPARSFYEKRQSDQIAKLLMLTDIAGTDLAPIIEELERMGAQARQY